MTSQGFVWYDRQWQVNWLAWYDRQWQVNG